MEEESLMVFEGYPQKLELLPSEIKERAKYLLKNRHLGGEIIGWSNGEKVKSSCYGTSLWMTGDWAIEECRKISERIPPAEKYFPSFYWEDKSRPGWCEANVMQAFLAEYYEKCKNPSAGDLIAIANKDWTKQYWLYHVGIWTGRDYIAVTQNGFGGGFKVDNFNRENLWDEEFYFMARSK